MKPLTDLTSGLLLRLRVVEDAVHGHGAWAMAALGDDGSITSTSPASVALGSDYVEFKADLAGPIHGATPGALFYDGQARLVFAIAAQRPALEGDTLLVTYRLSLAADFIRV